MEFRFSTVVDPATYETEGLCEGIPLRCHHNPEFEEIETLRCQEDWREYVGPLGFYKGGLGPRWNFMAITVPECLPERLGVLGYANELAFLHDDVTDIASLGELHNNDLMVAFEQGAATGKIENAVSGKRAIQSKIALEMLAFTMKAWAKFAELGSGRQHQTHFKTEAEYIAYRMVDIGTMFWYGMVTFGMGISIPKEELDLCHELANTAYLNLGLTNDLYSWQKKYETSVALGQDYVVNVISVLMEEHSISEEEAKALCRVKIKATIVDFRRIGEETMKRTDVSVELKKYLEALLYSLSGNLVWSLDCPRYHRWSSYNERQLDWMENGIPRSDKSSTKGEVTRPNGSLDPKTAKTNGVSNGEVSSVTAEVTNHSSGTQSLRCDDTSSNGMVDTSLVNVFATQKLNGLGGAGLHDETTTRASVATELHTGCVLQQNVEDLSSKVIQAPYEYISSLPSKGVREQAIDALNVWLDDLEDGSRLRRGKPSTHTIFGAGQTVNSANYQIVRALEEVQKLGDVESLTIFTEELKNLYVGQSLDLYWTSNLICPSVDQYFKMVENKTGGLFRLFSRLMAVHSTRPFKIDLGSLVSAFGRYYQTRDDYQNLVALEYTKQKGFCEDLDEGKYSLPLIHLIHSMSGDYVLRNILTQRRVKDQSSLAHKQTILDMMEKEGSLKFTAEMLGVLHAEVEKSVEELEKEFGVENLEFRLIVAMLKI
ncbi:hypothetical protein G7Y79_00024g055570 [Physcia stellaris]|nr:hypothetical protein G7Y79_00024g055570 [Physcia stellaris]